MRIQIFRWPIALLMIATRPPRVPTISCASGEFVSVLESGPLCTQGRIDGVTFSARPASWRSLSAGGRFALEHAPGSVGHPEQRHKGLPPEKSRAAQRVLVVR